MAYKKTKKPTETVRLSAPVPEVDEAAVRIQVYKEILIRMNELFPSTGKVTRLIKPFLDELRSMIELHPANNTNASVEGADADG